LGVTVEKLLRQKFEKNKIALGCPTNDFSNFLDILYPPIFGCLGRNWSFSTATGYYVNQHRARQPLTHFRICFITCATKLRMIGVLWGV